ncbi:hypothetical protein [Saccharomonospora viridis]|uniref:hypothetical protein n=1 Tax=Saccharomonospora viridis TaxID=1852 RepID=UPI0023F08625|nr:hypothetical protein [Saccharomonospora viridis]
MPVRTRTSERDTNVLPRVTHWPGANDLRRADPRMPRPRVEHAKPVKNTENTENTAPSPTDESYLAFLNRVLEGLRAL